MSLHRTYGGERRHRGFSSRRNLVERNRYTARPKFSTPGPCCPVIDVGDNKVWTRADARAKRESERACGAKSKCIQTDCRRAILYSFTAKAMRPSSKTLNLGTPVYTTPAINDLLALMFTLSSYTAPSVPSYLSPLLHDEFDFSQWSLLW